MKNESNRDYVEVTYRNESLTDYPEKLSRYICDRFNLLDGQKLLDLGCGRGEYLHGFNLCGLKTFGIDQSSIGQKTSQQKLIKIVDLENEPLPYDDEMFDVIFCKSVLEHFYYPEKIVQEIFRILKKGGLVISMVPEWESQWRIFYIDYTHRTPFSLNSFEEIFLLHGFDNVQVERFRQLPFLWKNKWLNFIIVLIGKITPWGLRKRSKLLRFSKEVMLLSTAYKP